MNPVLQAIESRRSVRRFKPDMVPAELLDQVLQAGTYAATGMGRQSPIILAVTDPKVRDQLSRMCAAIMGSEPRGQSPADQPGHPGGVRGHRPLHPGLSRGGASPARPPQGKLDLSHLITDGII